MVERLDEAPFRDLTGKEFEHSLKSTANRLLAALVESPRGEAIVSKFKTYKIDVSRSTRTLLTSDRPITVSAQLVAADAFMILPYAPDRLAILTHHEAIARAFASQPATTLVKGINEAVVEQSADIVIGQDDNARQMIDRLFLRPQVGREYDAIGLIRRRSPLVDMQPRARRFSRHDKAALKYLGS